jgi:hypothetical protein
MRFQRSGLEGFGQAVQAGLLVGVGHGGLGVLCIKDGCGFDAISRNGWCGG